MAHLEPELYRQFYAVAKVQAGNAAFNKWDDYGITIDKEIWNKIQNFVPINEYGKSNKGFRTSKNGRNTGIFEKLKNQNNNNFENVNFNNKRSIEIKFTNNNLIEEK